ncbi:MAG: hypothetical protein KF914_11705 [Rhizobiaceae bacterium]|nr:hypothetical protein [Rhizobiaceae bacterium]
MHQTSLKGNPLVAFVAALVLLMQAFTSAWAAGAMPIPPMLDSFGNPLCITGTDLGGTPSDHSKLPNCCTFGCGSVSPVLQAPDFDGAAIARPLVVSHVLHAIGEAIVAHSPDHDPGSPRAPPLTA